MNMPEQDTILASLHEDIGLCKEYFSVLSSEIRNQDISKYPIFVASKTAVDIGRLIVQKEELDIEWSFYASHLEDFVNRNIILMDKVDTFRKAYKNPEKYFCLFIVGSDNGHFAFIPY